MKSQFVFIFFIIALASFTSCKHEIYPGDPIENIDDFFKQNQATAESFTIDAAQGGTFTTQTGVEVIVGKKAFLQVGGPITSGNINLEITHFRTIRDMILADIPTQARDGILITDGSFLIEASDDAGEVYVTNSEGVILNVPASPVDTGMSLFNGFIDPYPFYWYKDQRDSALTAANQLYSIKLDRLGWINIDRYADSSGAKATVEIAIPAGYKSTQIRTFLVFRDSRSVIGMYENFTSQGTLKAEKVPADKNVSIIVVAEKEKHLHFSHIELLTQASDVLVTPDLRPATIEEINAILETF